MEPSTPATPTNPDKPFRTIEVLDARTNQLCKVACMSCIRGHRTTSCGIPVCRTKIFWTVKRPGRPSNSCTCRFGASGRCQCVVARSACPHKAKKGEKRKAGECRCDEQGRFCCSLEPGDWDVLCSLGKPRVQFFASREDLEAAHAGESGVRGGSGGVGVGSLPPTPAYSVASPQSRGASVPGTPTPLAGDGMRFVNTTGDHFGDAASPARPTTRFGMMGLGAPLGDDYVGQDVLAWDGQSPQTSQDFQTYHDFATYQQQPPQHLTDPTSSTPFQPLPYPPQQHTYPISPPPITESFSALTLPTTQPSAPQSTFDFQTFISEYTSYQFPTAICQHCGMNGCTCKNCPAVMQNFESGSWAQCCSRKHVKAGPQQPQQRAVGVGAQGGQQGQQIVGGGGGGGCCGSRTQPIAAAYGGGHDPVFTEQMDVDHELKLLAVASHAGHEEQAPTIDLSDFLMKDLERGSSTLDDGGGGYGCCCGD